MSEACLRSVLVETHAIIFMVNPHSSMVKPYTNMVDPHAIMVNPNTIMVEY